MSLPSREWIVTTAIWPLAFWSASVQRFSRYPADSLVRTWAKSLTYPLGFRADTDSAAKLPSRRINAMVMHRAAFPEHLQTIMGLYPDRTTLNRLVHLAFQADLHLSYTPDLIAILPDRSIGRKFAHSCAVKDRHTCPLLLVLIDFSDPLLTVDIGLIIRENKKLVAREQRSDERLKNISIAARKLAGSQTIDYLAQLRIILVVIPRIIAAVSQREYLVGS